MIIPFGIMALWHIRQGRDGRAHVHDSSERALQDTPGMGRLEMSED